MPRKCKAGLHTAARDMTRNRLKDTREGMLGLVRGVAAKDASIEPAHPT